MSDGQAILLVDDHAPLRRSLARYLGASGYTVHVAGDGEAALELLESERAELAIVDMVLPGMGGMALLEELRSRHELPVIMMTGFSEAGSAVEAVERGAYEFLTKPVAPELLPVVIQNALEHHRLLAEQRLRQASVSGLGRLVGRSASMLKVFDALERVAATEAPVLLTGETGTGKNLVAQEIHARSSRANGPLIHLNCAAVSGGLFESELFGHEKGAFTGAETRRSGRFERAHGGTLLLDEVDCLPPEQQAKLLHVLENGEYERVGGIATQRSDARILAATNQDLPGLVAQGKFRRDLFYRLATFPIRLPPLRERPEDIPLLVRRFLDEEAEVCNRDTPGITPEAMLEAQRHPWPGNVRELANAVLHAILHCAEGEPVRSVLPPASLWLAEAEDAQEDLEVGRLEGAPGPGPFEGTSVADYLQGSFREATTAFQRFYLGALLARVDGNKTRAVERAKIDRRTLQRHLKRLGLDGPAPWGPTGADSGDEVEGGEG